MQTHTAIVIRCDQRTVNTKDGRSFPLNEVHDSLGGSYVAKKQVWDQAQTLLGQQCTWVTRVEEKGNFTNYYLDAIFPANQVAAPQTHPLDSPTGVTQDEAIALNAGWSPDTGVGAAQAAAQAQQAAARTQEAALKDLHIYRQTAAKVASWLAAADQHTFWMLLPELMKWFQEGKRPDFFENQTRIDDVIGRADDLINAVAEQTEMPSNGTEDDDSIPF